MRYRRQSYSFNRKTSLRGKCTYKIVYFKRITDLSLIATLIFQPKEQKRVLDAHESTDHPYVWHGMSRIIGDVHYKRRNKHVIPNPEVFSYDLSKYKCKFLILGTDGVFEHFCREDLDEQMIITHLNENLNKNLLQAMTNVFLRFKELRYDGDNKTLMVIKITQVS